MIIKLLPEQISKYWDIIRYAVEQSLPPIVGEHPDKMNHILSSLLCNKTQCWASYTKNEEGIPRFEGISLTRLLYDDASDTLNLLIYCLYGYEEIAKESWAEALKTVAKYAHSQRCSQIIAYTDVPYVVEKAKEFGGGTGFTFISFDVNETVRKLNNL